MKSKPENLSLKMAYSTPDLSRQSSTGLADRIRERSMEKGQHNDAHFMWDGSQAPPLIIEGFEGEVVDLVEVLSLIDWGSHGGPQRATEAADSLPVPSKRPHKDGICILLVDMRRRNTGGRQSLTRIETDSVLTGTLALILTEPGENLELGSENLRKDRWLFSGSITPVELGVLVKSVHEIWIAGMEMPANASSPLKIQASKARAIAHAERN
jgi:hypothetical protein